MDISRINGYPVSFANAKNDANIGLTKEQVLLDENTQLNSIQLNMVTYFVDLVKSQPKFYNDERVIFLENFYKYCKENSNDFNINKNITNIG